MKQHTRATARFALAAALTGCVGGITLLGVPGGQWLHLGQQTALLSVGLRQPQNTMTVLAETLIPEQEQVVTVPPLTVEEDEVSLSPIETTLPSQSGGTAPAPSGGGTVLTKQYGTGATLMEGVAFQNNSKAAVDMAAVLKKGTGITLQDTDKPQVLITHTHTTECYLTHDDGVYTATDETRSHDNSKTVVAVGEAIATQLRLQGIEVIHDTAIHDEPYSEAYGSSKAAIQKLLKQYPTIQVVLDIHRDAIYPDATTRVKPTAVVGGRKAAQVMVLVGMKNTSAVPNPYTEKNLQLGAQLQQELHRAYPGLARPMLLADGRYNQQLHSGSLLIEVGADANTAAEAIYAGELLGKSLAQVLRG